PQTSPFHPCLVECIVVDSAAPITGTQARLYRTEDALSLSLESRGLVPGNVYTVWFVVVNEPEYCVSNPSGPLRCGAPDIFNPVTKAAHVWAGAGGAARIDGTVSFTGYLEVGDLSHVVFPWEPGLLDPIGSEVVVALRDHGPSVDVPDQTSTMNGSCFQAIVMPGTGTPGTNMCENRQAAMFPAAA
ncbi:MAG: hypothetical protein ACRDJM_06810, partial [Actinomycetota bacterium]